MIAIARADAVLLNGYNEPGAGALPRECVVIDISESKYKMVWRFNQQLDTKFVGIVWQGTD